MARDLPGELKKAEKQFNATFSRMKQIQQEFIDEVADFMKTFYLDVTKRKVKNEAELTQKLGIEKISRLKSEVSRLQSQARQAVAEFIPDGMFWHHGQPEKPDPAFRENLEKGLRLVAGKLGPILEKYGYITTDPEEPGYWREWDEYGINRPDNARPFYPMHLDWTERMNELIHEYEDLIREGIQYSWEVKKLKQGKMQSEVEDLWKNA